MRGAGDHLSIAERIAFYRRRRGYTQAVLAQLVGRTEDWLSKVERGERQIRRLDVLMELAGALRITLADLLGQPVLVEDNEHRNDVPAIRDALMSPQRLSKRLFGTIGASAPAVDVVQAAELAEQSWSDYTHGRLGRVIDRLPQLIVIAQRLEEIDEPAQRRRGWAASARIHHLAATTLSKIGEADLAWIAAERAMRAADEADDPLVLASAARAGTHALLAVGRYHDAMSLGITAAEWLRPQVDANDPEALTLFGMLNLRTAIAAARRQDRATAGDLLDRAEDTARALGRDANYWQTGFGPTNVELHRFSAALDLGDVAFIVNRGPLRPLPDILPVERQVSHFIDVGRAQALAAHDDDALQLLLTAENAAPELVRHHPGVRETVRAMHRRSPATAAVAELATRCRAV